MAENQNGTTSAKKQGEGTPEAFVKGLGRDAVVASSLIMGLLGVIGGIVTFEDSLQTDRVKVYIAIGVVVFALLVLAALRVLRRRRVTIRGALVLLAELALIAVFAVVGGVVGRILSPTSSDPAPLNQGTLTLPGDTSLSADLDTTLPGWGKGADQAWVNNGGPADINYVGSTSTLDLANAPLSTAVLPLSVKPGYSTCLKAVYDGVANYTEGANIRAGRAICFQTPQHNLALIQIEEQDSTRIVMMVTVWPKS